MVHNDDRLAEVQIDTLSQTAGQNSLDLLASVWFVPGEIHIDDARITFGFVSAFLELSDTLDSKYNDGLQIEFGKISWRDVHQLEKKCQRGVLGNIDFSFGAFGKAEASGSKSRSTVDVQAREATMDIPLYTLQSIASRKWVMYGLASASQLLHGRVVHTVEQPLVKLSATYLSTPGEVERETRITVDVTAMRDDLDVIVTRGKDNKRDPTDRETEAVAKAVLARALTRGRRAYDVNGKALPLVLARGQCDSRLRAKS